MVGSEGVEAKDIICSALEHIENNKYRIQYKCGSSILGKGKTKAQSEEGVAAAAATAAGGERVFLSFCESHLILHFHLWVFLKLK